jgi:2-dehydro-3-deoxygluconokinase
MKKVCCFGEILLRFSPDVDGNWLKKNSMPVHVGGAELNVASALAKWNVPVSYVSAAPDNYLTRHVTLHVADKGIDTNQFIYSGDRIGSYFLPQGTDLKHAGVIYDRAYSSFYELAPNQVDWEKVLDNISWLHFSAISPAVSESAAAVCKEALEIASAKNITISVDLNYRAKLWQYGKQPKDIMPELTKYCDVVMGNLWAAEQMLEIEVDKGLKRDKESFVAHAEKTSGEIMKKFVKCKQVANTFRLDADGEITYYATLFTNNRLFVSKEHRAETIVDKIGSGDCFMAGLIYGNVNQLSPQETIDFAAAAAFDKLFVEGDATTSTVEDIRRRL